MEKSTSASALEKIAGSPLTVAALTTVAAISGGILAPLLPALADTLATRRFQERVEAFMVDVNATLATEREAVREMTEEQLKVINECVLAAMQTTRDEKLAFLKAAVAGALTMKGMNSQESVILSRVLRDISVEEATFLVKNFRFSRVALWSEPAGEGQGETLVVDPSSPEGLTVSGLVALGLLVGAGSGYDALQTLIFTGITAKLIVLLGGPHA